jgi:hypothetical protein
MQLRIKGGSTWRSRMTLSAAIESVDPGAAMYKKIG